jgi:hypothetical protein
VRIAPVCAAWLAAAAVLGCLVGKDPKLKEAFTENFDSGRLDPQLWKPTLDAYEVRNGALFVEGAKNHPMWLMRRIPCDVKVDFTAWSESREGDIKVEIFGDGRSSADDEGAYVGTGYVVIFGGWNNTVNTIARRDEHEGRMLEENETKVEPNRKYQWSIRVRGGTIDWYLDGKPFLHVEDQDPLCGPGNDHFAFSNWATQVHFDDLSIVPL